VPSYTYYTQNSLASASIYATPLSTDFPIQLNAGQLLQLQLSSTSGTITSVSGTCSCSIVIKRIS
jgi:hypothetical protein